MPANVLECKDVKDFLRKIEISLTEEEDREGQKCWVFDDMISMPEKEFHEFQRRYSLLREDLLEILDKYQKDPNDFLKALHNRGLFEK